MKVTKTTESERKTEALAKKALSEAEVNSESKDTNDRINRLIRERYSLSEELAITRHALAKLIAGEPIPEEYAAFNAYVEECKAKANSGHAE